MCDVGQVVVLGAPRKLLQFSVGQVKSPARGSLLERLLHAPACRYCGRQLGSIPSSHQTYRSAFSFTLFEASTPLSYPSKFLQTPNRVPVLKTSFKVWKYIRGKTADSGSSDCVPHTTGAIVSTTYGELLKLSIFQEVASNSQISQQDYRKRVPFLQDKST